MQNYLIYFVVIVFLIFMFYRKLSFTMNKKITNISAKEAFQLVKANKDLIIIDVRTPQEFKSGHISGSKSFPVGEIASRINELMKYKEKPILVHCAAGSRSPTAVRILLKNGFNNIYHMKRGLIGWNYNL
ncbi:rhodanese-like domain-containing protein [Dehalobacter restrictus]|uniref:rhodanese-like domain-containing protein n=1 Tax=Dehalobacter restrictus TaxID=55583 RepID=UPI00338D7151